jgi:hypothetical protein
VPALIGVVLALSVGIFATAVGLDRDRAFYPVVTIVIASYYVLFAVMGNSMPALAMDALVCLLFAAVAVAGFKRSLWIVTGALAGHGVLDSVHAGLMPNPGVPSWWPAWCLAYDVTAAAYLAWLLKSGRVRAVIRARTP